MKTFKQFQEGLVKKALVGAALATPFLAKKFLKPKTDKMLDTERKTNKLVENIEVETLTLKQV